MMILSHYLTSFPRCFCVPPNKQMFFIILLDRLVANYWGNYLEILLPVQNVFF